MDAEQLLALLRKSLVMTQNLVAGVAQAHERELRTAESGLPNQSHVSGALLNNLGQHLADIRSAIAVVEHVRGLRAETACLN